MKNNNNREEQFKNKEKKIKKSSNRFLYTFIIIFVTGYATFLTSELWLPNTYQGVEVTPLGTVISQNDRNVLIDEWSYSKDQKLMEILIEIENYSLDGIDDYVWVVKTKDGSYKTTVAASDEEFVVLHAENIRRDWTEASLTMDISDEYRTGDETSKWEPLVIYTNNKIVDKVDSIETKDLKEYKIAAYTNRISLTKEKLKKAYAELENINSQIDEAQKNVKQQQEKMEYQTESEQLETSELIDGFNTQISNLSNQKEQKIEEISDLEEKIRLTEKLMQKTEASSAN